jgi:hypothetical protein
LGKINDVFEAKISKLKENKALLLRAPFPFLISENFYEDV